MSWKSESKTSENAQFGVVDEYEDAASLRKLEEHWLDFYSYTIELAAANLSFIS